MQHRRVGGEQHHVQRGLVRLAEALDACRRRGIEHDGLARAGERRRQAAPAIGWEIERLGGIAELRTPEREQLVETRAAQSIALPERVVTVLDGQRRKRRIAARFRGGIGRPELAKHDAERPAVGDDVVRLQHERVVIGRDANQRRAEHVLVREVERRSRTFAHDRFGRLHRVRLRADVGQTNGDRSRSIDELARLAVDVGQPRAQGLVSRGERRERALERRDVERSTQTPSDGHVVRRHARHRAVQKPQQLLGEGHGHGRVWRSRDDVSGVAGVDALGREEIRKRAQVVVELIR